MDALAWFVGDLGHHHSAAGGEVDAEQGGPVPQQVVVLAGGGQQVAEQFSAYARFGLRHASTGDEYEGGHQGGPLQDAPVGDVDLCGGAQDDRAERLGFGDQGDGAPRRADHGVSGLPGVRAEPAEFVGRYRLLAAGPGHDGAFLVEYDHRARDRGRGRLDDFVDAVALDHQPGEAFMYLGGAFQVGHVGADGVIGDPQLRHGLLGGAEQTAVLDGHGRV